MRCRGQRPRQLSQEHIDLFRTQLAQLKAHVHLPQKWQEEAEEACGNRVVRARTWQRGHRSDDRRFRKGYVKGAGFS